MDIVVEGMDRGIKVVVEKLDCFSVEGEQWAGGQDSKDKKSGIDGEVKVVVEKLVTFFNADDKQRGD